MSGEDGCTSTSVHKAGAFDSMVKNASASFYIDSTSGILHRGDALSELGIAGVGES